LRFCIVTGQWQGGVSRYSCLKDLRHEATSKLFEKGLSPIEVATMTGHKTLNTLKRYTHPNVTEIARKLG
jgi:site-specific recombinase XerD